MRLAVAAALIVTLAACNQGDADNVMAPSGNALTPAQVDAALGPDLANGFDNQLDAVAGDNAAAPAEAVEAADEAEQQPRPEPEPEEPTDEPPADNSSSEQ